MFISTKHLVRKYGIDETIARFFVDREPPADNLYWHEKLLYLRPAPGYLFIPLAVDLLYKTGLDKQELLSERFVKAMEQIGHISALEETKKISLDGAIRSCGEVVKGGANQPWFTAVNDYLNGRKDNIFYELSTPFKSLHRGDVFLFSLSVLEFPGSLFRKIIETWFALISILLLLDDAEDIESDKETGDKNAYLESGLDEAGLKRIAEVAKLAVGKIAVINPTMAEELNRQYTEHLNAAHILTLLNPSA